MKLSFSHFPIISLALLSFILSACNPISYDVSYDNVSFDPAINRTVVSAISSTDRNKIRSLTYDIMQLGPDIDREEASFVAREAVLYPKYLANEYQLTGPPNAHNVLVNTGKRKRGLCYHWAQDMTAHIAKSREYKTLTLQRVVANQGTFVEHNVLTVAAKGKGIEDAYILDGWRNSGELLWMKTGEDPDYHWVKYTPRFPNKVIAQPENKYDNLSVQ